MRIMPKVIKIVYLTKCSKVFADIHNELLINDLNS